MIPKIIHYCWFSGEEKPEKIKECILSWKTVLRDYEIKEWTLDDFDGNIVPFVAQAINLSKWAFAADYFRIWVLYNFGGIYLDCDVYVNKPFDEFLSQKAFIGWEDLDLLEAHVIGSTPYNKWLEKLLEYYEGLNVTKVADFNNYIMPHVITKYFMEHLGLKRNFKKQVLKNFFAVYPTNIFTLDLADNKNVCEHLFLGSWNENRNNNYNQYLKLKFKNVFSSVLKRNFYFLKRYLKHYLK